MGVKLIAQIEEGKKPISRFYRLNKELCVRVRENETIKLDFFYPKKTEEPPERLVKILKNT